MTEKFNGPFFIRKFEVSDATIVVDLGDDQTTKARAEFNYTRNFLFLRESDFHTEFEKYRLKPILKAADGGIFQIDSGSILGKLAAGLPGHVQYDEPSYYYVATADQCLEIACFEEPKIRLIE